MKQKPDEQKERIAKFKPWMVIKFFTAILNKAKKDKIRNTNKRLKQKTTFKRTD